MRKQKKVSIKLSNWKIVLQNNQISDSHLCKLKGGIEKIEIATEKIEVVM